MSAAYVRAFVQFGWTGLHWASMSGQLGMVQYIVDKAPGGCELVQKKNSVSFGF